MKTFTDNQIRHVAGEFLCNDEIEKFVRLYHDTKDEDHLLEQLLQIKRSKLTSIQKVGDIQLERHNLYSHKAIGRGETLAFEDGKFFNKDSKHSLRWYEHGKGKYSFILEDRDDHGHLTVAEISPESQGKGYFRQMVKSIFSICFETKELNYVVGRASPPQTKLFGNSDDRNLTFLEHQDEDWRSDQVIFRTTIDGKTTTQESTRLMHMWLSHKYIYPMSYVDDFADPDQLIMLNPTSLEGLSRAELNRLDQLYPKRPRQQVGHNNYIN